MTRDERIAAAWALLRSYADWMPGIALASAEGHQERGEAGTSYVDCPSCGGRGKLRRGGREIACRACEGAGLVSVDGYTEERVPDPEQFDEIPYERLIRFRRVRCDTCGGPGVTSASSAREPGLRDVLELDSGSRHWWRQAQRERCQPCRGSGSIEIVDERSTDASLRRIASEQATRAGLTVSADWLDSALERRRTQWARGSYGELAEILRHLELRVPRLHAALLRHVVYEPGEYVISQSLQARLELVVEWIAGELPERVRVPSGAALAHSRKHVVWRHRSAAAEHERLKRDGEIAALVLDHGQAPEHVAEIHGVTSRRVRQIVASAAVAMSQELHEEAASFVL